MDSGILDSTGAMELVALLKSTFSITIDDDEIIPENLQLPRSHKRFRFAKIP